MAVWAETQGFDGVAEFLYAHSEEERQHMLKLMRFVNERGAVAQIPSVHAGATEYTGLKEVFESILAHETKVTECINNVVDLCLQAKDYTTTISCSGKERADRGRGIGTEDFGQTRIGWRRSRGIVFV